MKFAANCVERRGVGNFPEKVLHNSSSERDLVHQEAELLSGRYPVDGGDKRDLQENRHKSESDVYK